MTALLKVAGREGSFEKFPDFGDTSRKKKPSGWRAFPIFLETPRHGHTQDTGVMMIPLLLRYFYRGNIVFFFSIKFSYAQCIEQFTGQERLC